MKPRRKARYADIVLPVALSVLFLVALAPPAQAAQPDAYTFYFPVILGSPGGSTGQPALTEDQPELTAEESELTDLINAERISHGLGPVRLSNVLTQVARAHSQDMIDRDFFDHANPDGWGPGDRLDNAGYNWMNYGENIGGGYSSPELMSNGWMNSSGHRANMLDPELTEIGVAYVAGGFYGHYWTALFSTPR
jgi:uncharacterized protein YkwD